MSDPDPLRAASAVGCVGPVAYDDSILGELIRLRGGKKSVTELVSGLSGIAVEMDQAAAMARAGESIQHGLKTILDLQGRRAVYGGRLRALVRLAGLKADPLPDVAALNGFAPPVAEFARDLRPNIAAKLAAARKELAAVERSLAQLATTARGNYASLRTEGKALKTVWEECQAELASVNERWIAAKKVEFRQSDSALPAPT
jgi:hypothetical protein